MPRTLPTEIVQAMTAEATDALFLFLLTIEHEAIDTVRIVNNTEAVVSDGVTFEAFPFAVILPPDDEDAPPVFQVSVANITLEVTETVRRIAGLDDTATATVALVEFSDPDTVLAQWSDFDVTEPRYTSETVSFFLAPRIFLTQEIPGDAMTPARFPGIH